MSLFAKLRLRSHVRLFIIFVLSFIVPLTILTTVFLISYRGIYEQESQQSSCREMDSVAATIDSQFQSAAIYLSLICQDTDLQKHLIASENGDCTYLSDSDDIEAIALRYSSSRPSLLNTQFIVLSLDEEVLMGQECLGAPQATRNYLRMIQDNVQSPVKNTIWFSDAKLRGCATNDSYIYIARAIKDSSSWNTLGYAILRFRNSDLISMYLGCANKQRSVFIADSFGNIVSFIDNLSANEIIMQSRSQLMLNAKPIIVNGVTVYSNFLVNQWYIFSATATGTDTKPELVTATTLYTAALFLCVVLTLAIAYIISKRFTKPVGLLIDGMQRVEQGDLHSRVSVHTHDEFEDLANNYNKMISRIEELMRQVIFEQEQKRISDIRMLQSQINPHFLYNTLASIRYMVYTSPPQDVDVMLLHLIKFLKYALSGATVFSSLDRELEQLNNYIAIQRFGFDVPLRYEVDVSKDLGHYQIVKLLLQPLVENAVLHGLKLNPTDPLLRIQILPVGEEMIQIVISDNGPGFDTSILSGTQDESDTPHHHLGIANIRQRLWLHYGENYHFEITSHKEQGTFVTLRIPRLTEEDISSESFNS